MTPPASFPFRLKSPSGLSVSINGNGSIQRIDHDDVLINLFPGNELEGGPANIYLRVNGVSMPLLGPRSHSTFSFDGDGFAASGEWRGIRYGVTLTLAAQLPAWYWHVSIQNAGAEAAVIDLIHAQDIGLCSYWAARNNEYYVSQYIDHTPLEHPERGAVVASRQNQAMGGRNPWSVIGSIAHGVSFATDALQVFGLSSGGSATSHLLSKGLPGVRHQHEHSMAAIQDEPARLAPGEKLSRGFFGGFVAHHAGATHKDDLALVDDILEQPEAEPTSPRLAVAPAQTAHQSLFTAAPLIESLDLTASELDSLFGARREIELDAKGNVLSFFAGERSHVVMKAKELRVLRPHGHMLRTGSKLTPDESSLTSTCWMGGVFHSLVTQGHVGINRLISTARSYLGLFRSHGMRVFAEIDGAWRLLDTPSAFEISPSECRWIYKHAGGVIEVTSVARSAVLCLRIDVKSGAATRFLISTHIASNGDDGAIAEPVQFSRTDDGVFIRTIPNTDLGNRFPDGGFALKTMKETEIESVGGDELLFQDRASRRLPYVSLITKPSTWAGVKIVGHLVPQEPASEFEPETYWSLMTSKLRVHAPAGSRLGEDVSRLAEMLPWFAHNALIHYLSPRGLEQFSGGGWGSRDVTQGPVEMLLSLGETEPVRDLLTRVFKQQNPDGDWPQWFMFFDRERNIRPGDSHGDIVFWPLLALAQYLLASGDKAFLEESLPFFDSESESKAEHATVLAHVDRALKLIEGRVIPGTHLAAYGHGDWNDSLQPADPSMRERLCSSWTVTLHYQTLQTLASAFARLGYIERSVKLLEEAALVLGDFQQLLVVDDVIAGYAYFHADGKTDYLLHPRDTQTGVKYSALPMIHAIANGMLTVEQVYQHFEVIGDHLLAPDGIRLFDRPLPYRGGLMKFFQRAETATFFGREIGLMYTHAHLRFIEALARYGDADTFFDQLCRAVPINIQSRVPTATLRQSNCYYSSSDVLFKDRYEAFDEYAKAMNGEIAYEGGWRIYSSGAGISMAMILRCLLGLRREKAMLVIDPVMPNELDGLRIEIDLFGKPFEIIYRVGEEGCGINALQLNGVPLPFNREANPYRVGGAEVAMERLNSLLTGNPNRLEVTIE
jgi:cellobiose phosphorylase